MFTKDGLISVFVCIFTKMWFYQTSVYREDCDISSFELLLVPVYCEFHLSGVNGSFFLPLNKNEKR